jgi:hypothetical protein
MTSSQEQQFKGSRKKKLTERFQQYLDQISDAGSKRRYTVPPHLSLSPLLHDLENKKRDCHDDGDPNVDIQDVATNNYYLDRQKTAATSAEEKNKEAYSRKPKSRIYTCHFCGFTDATSINGQAFIKNHHKRPENIECYKKGLVHCPNVSCGRVFLTEKDMELHCSMSKNSSRNACLQAFNERNAIRKEQWKHDSTQIDVLSCKGGNITSIFDPSYSDSYGMHVEQYAKFIPFYVQQHNIVLENDQEASHSNPPDGYFNPRSHYYNLLLSHFDMDPLVNSKKIPQLGEGLGKQGEWNELAVQQDEEHNQFSSHEEEEDILKGDGEFFQPINEESTSEDGEIATDTVNMLSCIQKEFEYASSNMTFTHEFNLCFELELMLREAGAPIYLYDKIMKWAVENKSKLPSGNNFISRQELLKRSAVKVYGKMANAMKPIETQCQLPSGRVCGVTTFNIYTQIASLLSDASINKWENYFFTPSANNPFFINTFSSWDDDGHFDDIETGLWYARTQKGLISDVEKQILVPICLFIDGTVLSMSGSLSLEPVMLSVMIHNRETRKKPKAWRPIGYIHDLNSIAGKKYSSTVQKYSDYHTMLSVVLDGLLELLNNNEGFYWEFNNVPGVKGPVKKKLVFALSFIIGDTKGHDVLCGRMGSHNFTTGLCRDCDMTTLNSDKPDFACNFIKQSDLELMSPPEMKAKSFYFIEQLAFRKIPFGCSPYGINCATAIDVIHMFLLGIIEYLHQTFIDHLTSKQYHDLSKIVAFIATFSSRRMNNYPDLAHFRKGLDRKGIMTAKMKLSRCFLVYLALKSSYFRSRIINNKGKIPSSIKKKINERRKKGYVVDKKKQLTEEALNFDNDDLFENMKNHDNEDGTCDNDNNDNDDDTDKDFEEDIDDEEYDDDMEYDDEDESDADDSSIDTDDRTASLSDMKEENDPEEDDESCLIVLEDHLASHEPVIFTDDVYEKWVQLYESTLTFYKWLTSDRLSRKMFKHGKLSIAKHCTQNFMTLYAEVAKQWDGMGLKLTKFHQLQHWYFYIAMYGVPQNYDSSFCESHHIQLTKKTGRRTQRRQDTLAFQTSMRVYENNLLNSICQQYCGDSFGERVESYPVGTNIPLMEKNMSSSPTVLQLTENNMSRGARFIIKLDYMASDEAILSNPPPNIFHVFDKKPSVKFRWMAKRDRNKLKFARNIMDALGNKLSWFNNGNVMKRLVTVQGFTELRLEEDLQNFTCRSIVRCHPDYRGSGPWMDWIDVCWELRDDDGSTSFLNLPAHLMMMLDFDTAEYEELPKTILSLFQHSHSILGQCLHEPRKGIHIIIHSASDSVDDEENDSSENQLLSQISSRYKMEHVYQLVKLENIKDIAFVVMDPPDDLINSARSNKLTDVMEFNITSVSNPVTWGLCFEETFSKQYCPPKEHDLVLDEFNEKFHSWS